jgi:hypothetical protein
MFALAVLGGALALRPAPAAEDRKGEKPPAKKWLLDRALTLTPRGEPAPALKYRLLPAAEELRPGNAVPIYLRLVHGKSDKERRLWVEAPKKWNALPLDRLPLAEAKKFLDAHRYMLRQLEAGARRRTVDWGYTLDLDDPIGLLMPDILSMRNYVPLLLLQSRVAIAEGDLAGAVRVTATGLAMSRHLGDGFSLISGLIGVADASQFADNLLDLVQRPEAPNLYWALTALPRPLVGLLRSEEMEQRLLTLQFPELADLDRERPPAQWDALLKRVRAEHQRILPLGGGPKELPPGARPDDPAAKSPDLEAARKYLRERVRLPAARVKAMPPAEVLLRYIAATFEHDRDDLFKAAGLPYPVARPLLERAEKRLKDGPDTEAARLARLLLPPMSKVRATQLRLDRRIAALRVIEALRLHAAVNGGRLPDKLGDVTVVPVPDDPGTGKPFSYKREGDTATLTGTVPGEPLGGQGLRYRVTMRAR